AMKEKGYQPVGRDFPVFLHPQTKEEYALARTERKSGHGYNGFTFHASEDVPLEEDLMRRDLTINAMAEDRQGQIIDPYGGQRDLANKTLRHVSSAFKEDPLRILRAARFAARLHHLGFVIAHETLGLMSDIVASGEASYLVPERIWQETLKALMEPSPQIYFQTLEQCGALTVILPEIEAFQANGTPYQALKKAAAARARSTLRFASLFSSTSASRHGSESETSEALVQAMTARMRLPNEFSEIALLTAQQLSSAIEVLPAPTAESLMRLFENTDAFRRPERFADFIEGVKLCHDQLSRSSVNQALSWLQACRAIHARTLVEQGLKGKAVGEQLRKLRVDALAALIGNSP
ncbi:MAG: multifunctional CCA tRNA nucleotidyl transferase/2'3'-cyclic phosphodiesterase/2'nucleotidase/phosphatase, partial [Endozoicomonas sp.]